MLRPHSRVHHEVADTRAVEAPAPDAFGARRPRSVPHRSTTTVGGAPAARPGRHTAAILLAACLMMGCTGTQPSAAPVSEAAADAAGATNAPGATAVCGPVETPAQQGGSHLLGDRSPPVPYASTPPTSGWHASGAFTINVRGPSEALSEPQQVSVLEVGGVVASYRDLPPDDRGALEETATMAYPGRVAVTPYDRLAPGEVAFTAWGALQRCDGLDLDALSVFVDTYADPEPDSPGEH